MKFEVKPKPEPGDTRRVHRFAWLPFRATEEPFRSGDPSKVYIVWLETYLSHQVFRVYAGPGEFLEPRWFETRRELLYPYYV